MFYVWDRHNYSREGGELCDNSFNMESCEFV